jgi:hypothetical protein
MNLANGLKLYVVGERSGNPCDWSNFRRVYVAAHNAEEAVVIAGEGNDEPVAEIVLDEPEVLFVEEDMGPED